MSTPATDLREQLHEIADAAPAVPVDPTTWRRARAAQRRARGLATGAVAAVVAAVVAVAVLVPSGGSTPQPAAPTTSGLPARISPASGTTSSDLDLGVGVAAYVGSDGVAVVVTAADGVSHRLDLAGLNGPVEISPDGRQLAWAFDDDRGTSLQVADLTTGAVVQQVVLKRGRLRATGNEPVAIDTLRFAADGEHLLYTGRRADGQADTGVMYLGTTLPFAAHIEAGGATFLDTTVNGILLGAGDGVVAQLRYSRQGPVRQLTVRDPSPVVGACARGLQFTVLHQADDGTYRAWAYDVRLTPAGESEVTVPERTTGLDLSVVGCLPGSTTLVADRLLVRSADGLAVLTLGERASYVPVSEVDPTIGPLSVATDLVG